MYIERIITVVDSHTQGEPTRVLTGGLLDICGSTMAEKRQYFQEHMDYLRRGVMQEPRGHKDMFGSLITAPTHPDADAGVIFMDNNGCINMCGHGLIGTLTVMLETGMIKQKPEEDAYLIDTPAGLVSAYAKIEQGNVSQVWFDNVPSFMYQQDLEVVLSNGKRILVDISYGGNFFALVHAEDLGLRVELDYLQQLKEFGMEIKRKVNQVVEINHPDLPHIKSIDLVEIYDYHGAEGIDARNVVIFGESQYDRSPCGTGTSAKMAALIRRKELAVGKKFVYESIYGTIFVGEIMRQCSVGAFEGIIPRICGSAYITSMQTIIIDGRDPFKYGLST